MKFSQRDHHQIVTAEHNEQLNAKRVEVVGGDFKINSVVSVDNSEVVGILKEMSAKMDAPKEVIQAPQVESNCCGKGCGKQEPSSTTVVETKIERIEVPVIIKETTIQTVEIPKVIIEKEIIQGGVQIVETIKEVLPSWVKLVMATQLVIIISCIAAIIIKH